MEPHQRIRIKANVKSLIENTCCSVEFCAYLQAAGHLSRFDLEQIECLPGNILRACKFYNIIVNRKDAFISLLNALEKTRQSGALTILRQPYIPPTITPKKLWILPDCKMSFYGREKELNQLDLLVMSSDNNLVNPDPVTLTTSVCGTAGIGKTELCLNYIHNILSNRLESLAALYFDVENKDTLLSSLANITGAILGNNYKQDNLKLIIQDLIQFVVRKEYPCIFLFDNCNDVELLKKLIPKCSFNTNNDSSNPWHPRILITTQIKCIDTNIKTLHLRKMSNIDANSFLERSLGSFSPSESCSMKLVKMLDNHPLAIENAINFIQNKNYTRKFLVDDYFEYLEKSKFPLRHPSKCVGKSYPKPLSSCWDNAIRIMKADVKFGRIANKILYYYSYCGNSSEALNIACNIVSETETKPALKILIGNCLFENNRGVLEMPNILKMVLRDKAQSKNKEIHILTDILEENLLYSSGSREVYYQVWTYACHYKQLIEKYFLRSDTYSLLHVFVEQDDVKSVGILLEHFKKRGWFKTNFIEHSLHSKKLSPLLIEDTKNGICIEFSKAGFTLINQGSNYMVMTVQDSDLRSVYTWATCGLVLSFVAFFISF